MVAAETPYIRLSVLRGRPVVTEAGDAGVHVADLEVGDDGRTVSGWVLSHDGLLGREAGELPAQDVDHIGADAVVVEEVRPCPDDGGTAHRLGSLDKKTVLTDEGTEIGRVRDVVLRTARGRTKAVALELRADGGDRYLVLDGDVHLFGDVVVVPAAAARSLLETPEEVADAVGG